MPDDPKRFGFGAGSVLQEWVQKLPLRYQGVLVSSTRGCDSVPKEDPSKAFVRVYRSCILETPSQKPSSFIEFEDLDEKQKRFIDMIKNCDHLPHHFIMHIVHAVEILAYCFHVEKERLMWLECYLKACKGLHLNPETEEEMEIRLTSCEADFKSGDIQKQDA